MRAASHVRLGVVVTQHPDTPGPSKAPAHLVLASHVPHGERDVLVLHRLDVETCRGGHACDGEPLDLDLASPFKAVSHQWWGWW